MSKTNLWTRNKISLLRDIWAIIGKNKNGTIGWKKKVVKILLDLIKELNSLFDTNVDF